MHARCSLTAAGPFQRPYAAISPVDGLQVGPGLVLTPSTAAVLCGVCHPNKGVPGFAGLNLCWHFHGVHRPSVRPVATGFQQHAFACMGVV
jgi:hypothetical protein